MTNKTEEDRLFPLRCQLAGIKDGTYNLAEPYYFNESDLMPGYDFNRDIIQPGDEKFPDGCLGIRADDDFWCVAVLPFCYTELPFKEVVETLWEEHKELITITPDHGSIERQIYSYKAMYEGERRKSEHLETALMIANRQNKKLRAIRPMLSEHNETKFLAQNSYHLRCYETMLIAFAHPAKPMKEWKGVCEHCRLYVNDRVHSRKYINLRAKGEFPKDHFAITGDVQYREVSDKEVYQKSKQSREERQTILETEQQNNEYKKYEQNETVEESFGLTTVEDTNADT